MNLINLQTLQYPVSIYSVRAENPHTSYPDSPSFVPDGYAAVEATSLPGFDRHTQQIVELSPVHANGTWKQSWGVIALPIDEQQKIRDARATAVRKQRDGLLTQSDWTQLPDAPVDRTEWAAYRQALRDLPSQSGFPFDIAWPALRVG